MTNQTVTESRVRGEMLDALVVGAGFSGMAIIPKLQELKMKFRVIEAGDDVGGTWYWNRYPGARTDSESWYYCYSSDKDLLNEWEWSERYPSQPEVLKYLRHVADRYGYRQYVTFNSKMVRAQYMRDTNCWKVETSLGETINAKYLISAMGILSEPYLPEFKGIERYRGEWYRTGLWPKQEPEFRGKRVAIIGTGATGVQAIPVVAEQAAHLTVFQRTANYVIPGQNHPLAEEQRQRIKAEYDDIWKRVRGHTFGMPFELAGRRAVEATADEREVVFEECWRRGGFRYLFEAYDDVLTDPAANEYAAEFVRGKIRQIVKNPETAEKLCPKDHPFGGKRPPGGHGYYEAFNRDNVTLVDVKKNVISEITETGIRLGDGAHYEVDAIIFATGFDGFTGAFTAIDLIGEGGQTMRDHWRDGPRTFLGLAASGFPNMLFVNGPLTPFANNPPIIEKTAETVALLLSYLRARNIDVLDVPREAEDEWIKEVEERANETVVPLGSGANNWLAGANIPGKKVVVSTYLGGSVRYSMLVDREVAAEYPHFIKRSRGAPSSKSSRAAESA